MKLLPAAVILALCPLPPLSADTLTYRRSDVAANDASCTITPRYGSDLTGWTVAENGTNGVVISVDNDFYGAGTDRITVRIPQTLAGATGRMFAQLKVTFAQ